MLLLIVRKKFPSAFHLPQEPGSVAVPRAAAEVEEAVYWRRLCDCAASMHGNVHTNTLKVSELPGEGEGRGERGTVVTSQTAAGLSVILFFPFKMKSL